ncbi:MAG TPA: HAD family hydrolase [Bacteroidia bacterium]|nr:HAD family hydrolase [Bacteroidia bacterium]
MKNKAVFLDRDGVLNREKGDYIYTPEAFEILPEVSETLQFWQEKKYIFIVITNQGGISKGIYGHREVNKLHEILINKLSEKNIFIHEIYYCPHHPDQTKCICRKPDSLLIEKAIARFDIDTSQSYFIGDKLRDIEAAEKAGVKGILIEANSPLSEIKKIIF